MFISRKFTGLSPDLKHKRKSFKKDNRGVTAIEYGLIGVVMAGALTLVLSQNNGIVDNLKGTFEDMTTDLQSLRNLPAAGGGGTSGGGTSGGGTSGGGTGTGGGGTGTGGGGTGTGGGGTGTGT